MSAPLRHLPPIVMAVVLLSCPVPGRADNPNKDALEILKASRRNCADLKGISMRCVNEGATWHRRPFDKQPERWRTETFLRADFTSARYDKQTVTVDFERDGRPPVRRRNMSSGDVYVTYTGGPGDKRFRVFASRKTKQYQDIAFDFTMWLNGNFPYSGKRDLFTLLLSHSDRVRLAGTEIVDGTKCVRITADLPNYGDVEMLIAPEKGHCPLKIRYAKTQDDLFWNDRPMREMKTSFPGIGGQTVVGWTLELDGVESTEIDGKHVPMIGRMIETYRLGDGTKFSQERSYHRWDVELDPDFSKADAFAIDLPDGTPVGLIGEPPGATEYFLEGGKIVARERKR